MSDHEQTGLSPLFISYSHDDSGFVRQLHQRLAKAGIDAWHDRLITAGRIWQDELKQQIAAAKAVIVIVSATSIESQWVRKEVNYALRLKKKIFPLYLPSYLDGDMPWQIADIQVARSIPELIDSLQTVGGAEFARDLPPPPPITSVIPHDLSSPFFGRMDQMKELSRLLLSGSSDSNARRAGVVGMRGVGKSRFVAQFVLDHYDRFDDNIAWVDVNSSITQGLADYGRMLVRGDAQGEFHASVEDAFRDLMTRSLVVFDDIAKPGEFHMPLFKRRVLANLPAALIFTSGQATSRWPCVKLKQLGAVDAFQFLVSEAGRQHGIDGLEEQYARQVCELLGGLPLAIRIAAAFLRSWPQIRFAELEERLIREGQIAALDSESDPTRALSASLRVQWSDLHNPLDQRVMQICAQLQTSTRITISALALMLGEPLEGSPGKPSELLRAIKRISDACLVEPLNQREIYLHPLVREFARTQATESESHKLRQTAISNIVREYTHYSNLESQLSRRGVDAVQHDILTAYYLSPDAKVSPELAEIMMILKRQAADLRDWTTSKLEAFLPQQLHFEATLSGNTRLAAEAANRLDALEQPNFRSTWRRCCERRNAILHSFHNTSPVVAALLTTRGQLLTASSESILQHWDLETGEPCGESDARGEATCISVDETEDRLLLGYEDGRVDVCHLHSGEVKFTIRAHEGAVTRLVILSNIRRVVTLSWDNTMKVWSLADGEYLGEFVGHEQSIRVATGLNDGHHLASGGEDHRVIVWDGLTMTPVIEFVGHSYPISAVVATGDSSKLISASVDGTIRSWRVFDESQAYEREFNVGKMVDQMDVSSGGQLFAATSDSMVHVFDLPTGKPLAGFIAHEDRIRWLEVYDAKSMICTGSASGTTKTWSFQELLSESQQGHESHIASIESLLYVADGSKIVSASADCTARVWDANTGTLFRAFRGHAATIITAAFDPSGTGIVTVDEDGVVFQWAIDGEHLSSKSWPRLAINKLTSIAGSAVLLGAGTDGSLLFWNPNSPQEVRHEVVADQSLTCIDGSYDGLVVVGTEDGRLIPYEVIHDRILDPIAAHSECVNCVRFLPNSRSLLSASSDGAVKIWDFAKAREIAVCVGHSTAVNDIAVAPCGNWFATCGDDRCVLLWNTKRASIVAEMRVGSRVRAISFSPDGRYVAVGDELGTLTVLEVCGLTKSRR